MGYKEDIHAEHLASLAEKHAEKLVPITRPLNVTVIGDNGYKLDHPEMWGNQWNQNIGNYITDYLNSRAASLRYYPNDDAFDTKFKATGWDLSDIPAGWAIDAETDALITCCGETYLDWIENMNDGEISEIITNTLHAPIVYTRQFVRQTLPTEGRKTIIYIGSMAYNRVLNASSVYCAAKAGLAHFARCMAWELAPKGYDVYTIHPSNVEDTPMSEHTITEIMNYRDLSRDEAERYWRSAQLRPRMLQKDDIAKLVSALLGGEYGYASGSQIELSGGAR